MTGKLNGERNLIGLLHTGVFSELPVAYSTKFQLVKYLNKVWLKLYWVVHSLYDSVHDLHVWSCFNVNLTFDMKTYDLNKCKLFTLCIVHISNVYVHVHFKHMLFTFTHTHSQTIYVPSFSHTHKNIHTHRIHKIQMSPHSILCETLLSWLLPQVLLQRIGMLIKAFSLKLIRHWPGSFIKIDILLQHTQMSWSRTWERVAEQS